MKLQIKQPKKEDYPTFLTLFNAVCGFLAIIFAAKQNYHLAANMIIIAFIFDILDGMLARKLGVTSQLGAELDSLADAISFVVAPALLIYFKYFTTFRTGIIVASFIIAFGILRLAKFNLTGTTTNFTGMPTPFFAAITISFILGDIVLKEEITAIIFFILSYMMISPVKYPSFKEKGTTKYKYMGLMIIFFLSIALLAKINLLAIVITEFAMLIILLFMMFFDKKFITKRPLIMFVAGLVLLFVAFYTNQKFLLILPMIYSAVASPLIEMALNPKKVI